MSASDMTVGVATCGRPGALARCLAGLAAQTSPPREVLVIDQAPSADASAVAAGAGLRSVQYIDQRRLGLSASRNLALRRTSGTALAVTDDDCVPEPSWTAALAAALERRPLPAAVTGAILPLGEPVPGTFSVSLRESVLAADYSGRIAPWYVGSGGNFAAPAEVLRQCGGWDERLGAGSGGKAAEDVDLIYRLLLRGSIVRYDPAAVVRHERQSLARRMATRWSYGYGIGTMCGIWLTRRDLYAIRMLGSYARLHLRPLSVALRHGERQRIAEHARALAALGPGVVHGLRVARDSPLSADSARDRS